MSNAADDITPPGATHVKWSAGDPTYYKRTEHRHLNQVSERWQSLTKWFCWDFHTHQWEWVGVGFCDRHLRPLKSKGGKS